jgi:plasmid stabilization system protein ParE
MNYKIVVVEEAKIDLSQSIDWYKNINPKLAKRFLESFKEGISIIRKEPLHFQIRYDDVRIMMLTTFPYLIHYTLDKNTIIIKAIYHSSRNSDLSIL